MTVHAQDEYQIKSLTSPPPGYPTVEHADSFTEKPFLPTFEQRKEAFLAHVLRNPAPMNTKPVWYELIRCSLGQQPHEGIVQAALQFIAARRDCSDFVLHAILRLLYQFPECFSPRLLDYARQVVLGFKYFPNEPGVDSLCTWTENHYILYTTGAYLAGQLYPDTVFTNSGESGEQKMNLNRPRILRWMELRFRTGFSEWLSHVYYDEDLTALLSLVDFATDDELRRRAEMIVDLLLLDMALNSYCGVFGSTHGRAYENTKKWAAQEGTTDTVKLLFGRGIFSGYDNMSAAAFALSRYQLPEVIEKIAQYDPPDGMINRQRMGIRLAEMEKWGLKPDNFEDGMHYLTLEAYAHPRTINNTISMFDQCNWWENDFLRPFSAFRPFVKPLRKLDLLPVLASIVERDVCRNTREEVNIYTYKTADYMLSTAQDYRKGYGGDQQHIWQATLGQDAVCFTTHPAKFEGKTPNYWAGSGLLPRAAQYRNVVIVIYNLQKIPALYVPIRHFYTHAWLARDKFDQVVERDEWIFARRGQAYLALRSRNPYQWRESRQLKGNRQQPVSARAVYGAEDALRITRAEDEGREILADGAQNIWLCQLGRQSEDGSFEAFMTAICCARLSFKGLSVCFDSPGNGKIEFGWEGDLRVNGQAVRLDAYPRYDNPFMQVEFGGTKVEVQAFGSSLRLDWESGLREVESTR
jgi:hypothetical protein